MLLTYTWHFQAPGLHVAACLSSKVKELQAPRWTLLWSTMSGGVASFLPFTYYVYEWKLIRVPLHPHNGLVLASNIIKPSILGVIILASYNIHMYTMIYYVWLVVGFKHFFVCSHPSWNEDHLFWFQGWVVQRIQGIRCIRCRQDHYFYERGNEAVQREMPLGKRLYPILKKWGLQPGSKIVCEVILW